MPAASLYLMKLFSAKSNMARHRYQLCNSLSTNQALYSKLHPLVMLTRLSLCFGAFLSADVSTYAAGRRCSGAGMQPELPRCMLPIFRARNCPGCDRKLVCSGMCFQAAHVLWKVLCATAYLMKPLVLLAMLAGRWHAINALL